MASLTFISASSDGSDEITKSDIDQADHSANYKFPEAALGSRYQGTPAYISQADILTPIAPILNARSDTFLVRGYGEARSADGRRVLARAWCEAVVQRTPEPIHPDSSGVNSRRNGDEDDFGRRFAIRTFRWLNPDEV